MKCFNKKILIGAGVVVAGLFLFRPAWAVAALPLLLLAACPLSMIFMMRGMGSLNGQGGKGATSGTSGAATNADLDKQIADLQEEVRILRAASARQQTAADRSPQPVDFRKPDQSGPRP